MSSSSYVFLEREQIVLSIFHAHSIILKLQFNLLSTSLSIRLLNHVPPGVLHKVSHPVYTNMFDDLLWLQHMTLNIHIRARIANVGPESAVIDCITRTEDALI